MWNVCSSDLWLTHFCLKAILRGCFPGDDDYDRDDVLQHLDGILVTNPVENVVSYLLQDGRTDNEGKSWTLESIFLKFIPTEFIYSRSILLKAFADGLTLGGKPGTSDLRDGCGLAGVLRAVPLQAVQKILFSRHDVLLDDVLSKLCPRFCQGVEEWDGNESELISLRNKQEQFFENDFKRYLKERASQPSFLGKFVEFVTGSNNLPFLSPDETAFKIVVEFNLISPGPCCHPFARTCTNTIRLPGNGLYFNDYDLFCKKMDEAVESSYNKFNSL